MPLDGQRIEAGQQGAELRLGAAALVLLLVVGALVLAMRLIAAGSWSDGGYWAIGIAAAAVVAIAAGSRRLGVTVPVIGGMALAAEGVSAAFLVAIPGAVFASGYDGLVYALGLGAGCLLLQLLVAPRFAQSGAASLPELLARRFSGSGVGLLSAAIITASMVMLLAAELMAAGLVGVRLLGADPAVATIAAACAMLACFIVRGAGGANGINAVLYPLLLAALLLPLVALAAQWYGLPIPQLAYANSLWQLQGIEESLLEQELADPAFMRPMMTAFLSLSPVNFFGITLGLAVGLAALPSVLAAPLAQTRARNARHIAFWGLGFVALLLSLVPAVAVFARQSIATLIADRTPMTQLPEWIFTYGRLGLLEVCGRAATDVAAVARACAALPDASPALRLQDVAINSDVVTLALPEITGIDSAFMGLIAIAVLTAALATAHKPISVIVQALGLDAAGSPEAASRQSRLGSYAVGAAVVAAGAALALARPASMIDMATWALVLAAAGLFPVLTAALWWRRANGWGAAAGMLAGIGALLFYLCRKLFAVSFFAATSALSSGGASGRQSFDDLKDAWIAADPGPAKDAAWAELAAHAQTVADWWGINGPATVLLALPVGFLVLIVVSLSTPATGSKETRP